MSKEKLRKEKNLLRDGAEVVIASAMIAWFLLTYVVKPTKVEGISMQPTLHTGQRLVMEKVSILFTGDYSRNDVVIIRADENQKAIIKRVVATAGDTVTIQHGILFVQNEELEVIATIDLGTDGITAPMKILPDHIYVLGDNLQHSNDSRAAGMGQVHESHVLGKAAWSYYPLDTFGSIPNATYQLD